MLVLISKEDTHENGDCIRQLAVDGSLDHAKAQNAPGFLSVLPFPNRITAVVDEGRQSIIKQLFWHQIFEIFKLVRALQRPLALRSCARKIVRAMTSGSFETLRLL